MIDVNYVHTEEIHNTQAAEAFLPTLFNFIQPASVIDVGCGTGTWLKVFKENGVKDIMGIDGSNVNMDLLSIPVNTFFPHDLREPFKAERKFDLAICLEVAEHLPETNADNIINILTESSDTILFSAALPMQGGQNHLNEQPFVYWVEKFNSKGFEVRDVFREKIWNQNQIDWWYRQNMFLVVKSFPLNQKVIRDYYHPGKISFNELERKFNELERKKCSTDLKNSRTDINRLHREINNLHRGRIPPFLALKIFVKSLIYSLRRLTVSRSDKIPLA